MKVGNKVGREGKTKEFLGGRWEKERGGGSERRKV